MFSHNRELNLHYYIYFILLIICNLQQDKIKIKCLLFFYVLCDLKWMFCTYIGRYMQNVWVYTHSRLHSLPLLVESFDFFLLYLTYTIWSHDKWLHDNNKLFVEWLVSFVYENCSISWLHRSISKKYMNQNSRVNFVIIYAIISLKYSIMFHLIKHIVLKQQLNIHVFVSYVSLILKF